MARGTSLLDTQYASDGKRGKKGFVMIYLKSVLVGVGGAVLAAVLWITVKFILPMFLPYMISRIRQTGGASGARITSDSIWIAALVGFVAAFVWEWHRLRAG